MRVLLVALLLGASAQLPVRIRFVRDIAGSYGPQSSITCPGGAVAVGTGDDLQTLVTANTGVTAFCLAAGVHNVTDSVVPKTGNTFVGAYGAILDGSGWASADDTDGAFKASNTNINDVTIRNLVIRDMPQKCIYANDFFADYADNWTIEYNELTNCLRGLVAPSTSVVRRNYIHHNTDSGYGMLRGNTTLFEYNRFSFNGRESKIVDSDDITFRGNWVHNNANGIWFDSENAGYVVEDNVIEDNDESGIVLEISGDGIIRNNTIRNNLEAGLLIVSSQDVEAYGNIVTGNFRGMQAFLNCDALIDGFDLQNNDIHDNVISLIGSPVSSYAGMLSHTGTCDLTAYTNLSKNNTYTNNDYFATDTSSNWFYWEANKTFAQWQALPQDASGSLTVP